MIDPRTPNDPLALTLTRDDWGTIHLALMHSYDCEELREVHQRIMRKIMDLMLVGAPENIHETLGIFNGPSGRDRELA